MDGAMELNPFAGGVNANTMVCSLVTFNNPTNKRSCWKRLVAIRGVICAARPTLLTSFGTKDFQNKGIGKM
jgi:hypothetical protein